MSWRAVGRCSCCAATASARPTHAILGHRIPREEVESIVKWIKHQLDKIQPGARLEACGGYRRGKTHSNDVDIIITWPHQDGVERGVLDKLVERLLKKGECSHPRVVAADVNCASQQDSCPTMASCTTRWLDRSARSRTTDPPTALMPLTRRSSSSACRPRRTSARRTSFAASTLS